MKNCIKILGIIGIITTLSMQTVSAQNDRVNLQQHIKNVYPNGIPKKIIIEPEVKIFEKYKNSDASESAVAYTITIEEAEIKSGKIGEVVFSQPAVGDFIVTYPDSSTAFIKCNNHGLAEEVNKVMRYDRTIDDETIYFDQEKLSYDNSLNLKLRHTTIAPYDGQYNELPRFSYNDGCITDCYVDSDGPYITKFCYNTNDITKTKNTFCEEVSEKQFKEFYADKFWKEYIFDLMVSIPTRPYAANVLSLLQEMGHEIIILTARDNRYLTNQYEDTMNFYVEEWLTKNSIPYNEIIAGSGKKSEKVVKNNIDIMIEDKASNVEAISKIIPVLCFDAPYNLDVKGDNIVRVYSWYQIYKYFIDLAKNVE